MVASERCRRTAGVSSDAEAVACISALGGAQKKEGRRIFARRVAGWAMSASNDTALALAALERAVASRQPGVGVVHHSDRGSPYGSDDYINALDSIGAVRSMSRKGDCWDNAVAESFFATLEHECIQGRTPATFVDAHRLVGGYIDGFYNNERLHSTIGLVSPIEFELHSALLQEAA